MTGDSAERNRVRTPQRRPLDVEAVVRGLHAAGYSHVDISAQTGSTNTDLAERVKNTDRDGTTVKDMTVLLTEEQTAGRGRLGRPWTAPAHSQVIFSVLLQLKDVPPAKLGLLPLLTGLAVANGVRKATAPDGDSGRPGFVPAELKWPNDVLVNGKKLAGILVEAVSVDPHPTVIIGCGVNFDLTAEELPVAHATSIVREAAAEGSTAGGGDTEGGGRHGEAPISPTREDATIAILGELAAELKRWRGLGGAAQTILPRYRTLCATVGSSVRVYLPGDRELLGSAVDVSEGGDLIVRDDHGQKRTVSAGDVTHVRPGEAEWSYGQSGKDPREDSQG